MADIGPDLDDLAVLHAMADAARAAIRPYFRARGLAADGKNAGDEAFDPVTEGDRAGERAMRAVLAAARPHDGVFGEEYGETPGSSGRRWVLDPIDGTRAFVSGLLHWGVLIALHDGERAVLGALDQPYVGERFIGVADAPARAALRIGDAEAPLQTRPCAALAEATLFTTDPALFDGAEIEAFARVRAAARLTRYGGDCYAYAMVAAGHGDLVIESGLSAYDIQALIPIVEGAGGVVTDWEGAPLRWGGRVVAAGDARAHRAALTLLAG